MRGARGRAADDGDDGGQDAGHGSGELPGHFPPRPDPGTPAMPFAEAGGSMRTKAWYLSRQGRYVRRPWWIIRARQRWSSGHWRSAREGMCRRRALIRKVRYSLCSGMLTGVPQITLARTQAPCPYCEKPDLVKGVELRDIKPICHEYISQGGMCGGSLSVPQAPPVSSSIPYQPGGHEERPAAPPARSGSSTWHRLPPDGVDGNHLLGHGSTSASAAVGRSAALICPCISSTTLVAVSAPLLHASMTACA